MKSAGDKVHTVTIIRVQSILDDVGHCENVKNNFLNKPNYLPDARLKQPNSRAATARLETIALDGAPILCNKFLMKFI